MIKFIATDMDGTLLDDNKNFDKNLFDIILKLKEKGILFAIASGRQYSGLITIFEEVKDDIIFICQNGSHIVYRGETLYTIKMDKKLSDEIIKKGRTIKNAEMLACTDIKAYVENPSENFIEELGLYHVNLEIVEDLTKQEEFLKVSLFDFDNVNSNSSPIMTKEFKDKAQLCISGERWFDINDLFVNKGVGIKFIQDKFNISYNETMVFGDNYNDIGMFKSAYYSYAMSNANEEIKKHSRFIAESNNDNGVIKVINTLLK